MARSSSLNVETQEAIVARVAKRFEAFLKEEVDLDALLQAENKSGRFWLVELWLEKREFFKEFMAEVFFVGLFLLSFEFFHRALALTSLEPNQIQLLNKTHFYFNYGSLVILSFGFVITVVKSFLTRSQ